MSFDGRRELAAPRRRRGSIEAPKNKAPRPVTRPGPMSRCRAPVREGGVYRTQQLMVYEAEKPETVYFEPETDIVSVLELSLVVLDQFCWMTFT